MLTKYAEKKIRKRGGKNLKRAKGRRHHFPNLQRSETATQLNIISVGSNPHLLDISTSARGKVMQLIYTNSSFCKKNEIVGLAKILAKTDKTLGKKESSLQKQRENDDNLPKTPKNSLHSYTMPERLFYTNRAINNGEAKRTGPHRNTTDNKSYTRRSGSYSKSRQGIYLKDQSLSRLSDIEHRASGIGHLLHFHNSNSNSNHKKASR